MQNRINILILTLAVPFLVSSRSLAQTTQSKQSPTVKVAKAPAPPRDISGVWFRPTPGVTLNKTAPLTPWGEAQLRAHPTDHGGVVADSSDPLNKCDPMGFPRSVLYEVRGMQFVSAPTKMVQLFQYQKVWREIWTDGRALPQGAGGSTINAPDPRYYGYSVGHWDGAYSFVVDTVDTDDRTWLDDEGHPHSDDLHVQERYSRVDHDTLQLAVTIDDAKAYTEPYVAANLQFTWNPKQEFEEQLCIPSEAQAYMDAIANPAGSKK